MITKIEYKKAMEVVKQYEKEQSEKWRCEKCEKQFSNPFDEYYCTDGFDLRNDKDCKGKNFMNHNDLMQNGGHLYSGHYSSQGDQGKTN